MQLLVSEFKPGYFKQPMWETYGKGAYFSIFNAKSSLLQTTSKENSFFVGVYFLFYENCGYTVYVTYSQLLEARHF